MAVDVTDHEELVAWLETQSREVVTGFAARAALRILPFLAEVDLFEETPNYVILPVFHLVALTWFVAKYPAHNKNGAYAMPIRSNIAPVSFVADAAYAAYITSTANADSVVDDPFADYMSKPVTSHMAAASVYSYVYAAAVNITGNPVIVAEAVIYATQSDVDKNANMSAPLWGTKLGDQVPEEIEELWQKLKTNLLTLNSNWKVWTDWYEAHLWPDRFASPIEDIEVARVLISDDIWKQGWQVVNPHIEGLIEEHRPKADPENLEEPEPQSTAAQNFNSGDDGLIDINTHAGVSDLQTDDDARDRHSEALRLAEGFVNGFDRDEPGANQATGLLEDIRLYIEAIGQQVEEIRPGLLVTRGDGLRQTKHLQENPADLSSLPDISDKHLLALGKIVAAHNSVVGLDHELARRDEIVLGPDAKKNLVSPEEGQRVLHNAVEIGSATLRVEEIMAEEAAIAPEIPDPENRKSRRYSEGVKNFARVVLGKVWNNKGKIAGGVTGSIGSAKWMLANDAWLLKIFADNPHMLDLVTRLIDVLKTLPLL